MTDAHRPGTPPGTDPDGVDRRSALAEHLGMSVWPARRDELVARAEEANAPDGVLADLRRLPGHREFGNVQDVAAALGLGTEQHRF